MIQLKILAFLGRSVKFLWVTNKICVHQDRYIIDRYQERYQYRYKERYQDRYKERYQDRHSERNQDRH